MAEIEARLGRPEGARAVVDEALATLETLDVPARSRAELLFVAAKALDPSDRKRAVELAKQALATYGGLGDRVESERIEDWIAER